MNPQVLTIPVYCRDLKLQIEITESDLFIARSYMLVLEQYLQVFIATTFTVNLIDYYIFVQVLLGKDLPP